MFNGLIAAVVQAVANIISLFIKNQAKRNEFLKKIKAETDRYQKGVTDSSKLKDAYDDLDKKLDEEWNKKFGNGMPLPSDGNSTNNPVTSGEPGKIEIEAPDSVVAGVQFQVFVRGISVGTEIYADKKHLLMTFGTRPVAVITLNTPGARTLDVKVGDTWYSKNILVKSA